MPTPTYTPLANITLSSTVDSVTFTSIAGTYRDLILVCTIKTAATGGPSANLRLNADTGANYYYVEMRGNGSSTSSAAANTTYVNISDILYMSNNNSYQFVANLMDYSATDKHKTVLVRANQPVDALNSGVGTSATANRWASTSAITSIKVEAYQATTGSTFALYGVAA